MNSRPQLILDAAGVIVSNLSASFWEEITDGSVVTFNEIRKRFYDIKEVLWAGLVSEQEFWEWLNRQCPGIQPIQAKALLQEHLQLLPSSKHLERWSTSADLHLLSNHRHEWLLEVLEPVQPSFKTITISSQTGYCKPDPRIFRIARSKLTDGPIIFVDDQEKNLLPAYELFNWTIVLADSEGQWIDEVDQLLSG